MLVKKEIYGSTMLLDTEDPGLSADLWRDGTREWNCPELMMQILTEDMVCIDIGACLGFYAFMEARMCRRVFAIEPNPNNFRILNKAVELNGFDNISVHNIAIGSVFRHNDFLIEHRSNLGRMVHTRARDIPPQAIVDTVTVPEWPLDDFTQVHDIKRLNLLRFDIESYEVELIEGAQRTLSEMPAGSWIFGEFHTIHFENPARDLQPAVQSIIDHGFVPRHVVHLLNGDGVPVAGMENFEAKDFARALCEDYPLSAPRVFLQKCLTL